MRRRGPEGEPGGLRPVFTLTLFINMHAGRKGGCGFRWRSIRARLPGGSLDQRLAGIGSKVFGDAQRQDGFGRGGRRLLDRSGDRRRWLRCCRSPRTRSFSAPGMTGRSAPAGLGGFFPFFDRPYNQPQRSLLRSPVTARRGRRNSPRRRRRASSIRCRQRTIVVIGDSLADWLAYGLEDIYADQPQIGIERKIRPNSGLIHYEPRNDTLEWSQAVKDILATEKPAAIVVMLGLNDRVPLKVQPRDSGKPEAKPEGKQPAAAPTPTQGKPEGKQPAAGANAAVPAGQAAQPQQGQDAKTAAQPAPAAGAQPSEEQPAAAAAEPPRPTPGGTYEFHTDEWAQLYTKRIDDMIAVLKSKGVPVHLGRPAGGARPARHQRNELPRRSLSRARRQGRDRLRRHLGRLRRRERALHRAGSGFRRPDSPAAVGRRRSLLQGRRREACPLRRARIDPRDGEPGRAGGVAGAGSVGACGRGAGRGAARDRSGAAAGGDRRRRRRRPVGRRRASVAAVGGRPDCGERSGPRRSARGARGPRR